MLNLSSFHTLSYGLYIIASEFEGNKAAYVGNTGFQVTSSPATIAISCNKDNYSCDIIKKSKKFSLAVLQKNLDTSVVADFGFKSQRDINKFEKYQYKTGKLGIPVVVQSCIAAFECNVINQVDCGTHILFIGEVAVAEKLSDDEPLTYDYYHSHYKMYAPKNAPTYIDPAKLEDTGKAEDQKQKENGSENSEHVCIICGYTYDPEIGEPENGISEGTAFDDLPDDYVCPVCGAAKEYFKAV